MSLKSGRVRYTGENLGGFVRKNRERIITSFQRVLFLSAANRFPVSS